MLSLCFPSLNIEARGGKKPRVTQELETDDLTSQLVQFEEELLPRWPSASRLQGNEEAETLILT